jgi:RimJ/RimL family protein N-acetyltransferase
VRAILRGPGTEGNYPGRLGQEFEVSRDDLRNTMVGTCRRAFRGAFRPDRRFRDMTDTRVVPTAERYADGLAAVVDSVARERTYIGFVEGPPVERMASFVRSILDGAGVQMLAVTASDQVVGWCDIVRSPHEGFRHVGRLGMGLLADYRNRGLGRALARQTIQAARLAGIERIELEVFASNRRAIVLYTTLGFVIEGTKRRARKLDGRYDDNVCMALLEPVDR